MYYPEELIEEIRMQNDIVDVISSYVHLTKKGSSHFGLCPFHNEKSPSFSVSPDKQMYYCFGCGAAGNVITFTMEYENFNFVEAIKVLAERVNIALPEANMSEKLKKELSYKQQLLDANKAAAKYFYYLLQQDVGKSALHYLINRGISEETRKKFGLGYSPMFSDGLTNYLKKQGFTAQVLKDAGLILSDKNDPDRHFDRFFNRVMFPIFDVHSRVIGFGGRVLGDAEPKYLNSPETLLFDKSRNLYGLNIARQSRKKTFFVVEGYMDVIAMHQAGFLNAIASLGTALTTGQASLMRRYATEVILSYDSDNAGTSAALRAIPVLKGAGLSVRVLIITQAKDPDEYIKTYGAEQFEILLQTAMPSFMFEIEQIAKKYNFKDPDHRTRFDKEVGAKLLELDTDLERDNYLEAICDLYQVKKASMEKLVNELGKDVGIVTRHAEATNESAHDGVQLRKRDSKDAVVRARVNALTFIASHPQIFTTVKEHLEPKEFVDGFYIQIAQFIYDTYEEQKSIMAASIINQFENVEEQTRVASIFNNNIHVENAMQFEKMLNENIKLVKNAYIDELSRSVTEPAMLQELILMKKKMQSFYISIQK